MNPTWNDILPVHTYRGVVSEVKEEEADELGIYVHVNGRVHETLRFGVPINGTALFNDQITRELIGANCEADIINAIPENHRLSFLRTQRFELNGREYKLKMSPLDAAKFSCLLDAFDYNKMDGEIEHVVRSLEFIGDILDLWERLHAEYQEAPWDWWNTEYQEVLQSGWRFFEELSYGISTTSNIRPKNLTIFEEGAKFVKILDYPESLLDHSELIEEKVRVLAAARKLKFALVTIDTDAEKILTWFAERAVEDSRIKQGDLFWS